MVRSEAIIDLGAIRRNVSLLRFGTSAEVMAVVKADGYGHGLVPAARAALAGGASWLGVAFLEEAMALRAAGITQWLIWSFSSPTATSCRARVAEETWVTTSGHQVSASIIFCRPRTWPSILRSRRR